MSIPNSISFRSIARMAVVALALVAVSCADEAASAEGEATIDGVLVTFPAHVSAHKALSQVDATVTNANGEVLSVIVAFDEGISVDCNTGFGYIHASVHYTDSDGTLYKTTPDDASSCVVYIVDNGNGTVTVLFDGTLLTPTGDSVEVSNGSITIHRLD